MILWPFAVLSYEGLSSLRQPLHPPTRCPPSSPPFRNQPGFAMQCSYQLLVLWWVEIYIYISEQHFKSNCFHPSFPVASGLVMPGSTLLIIEVLFKVLQKHNSKCRYCICTLDVEWEKKLVCLGGQWRFVFSTQGGSAALRQEDSGKDLVEIVWLAYVTTSCHHACFQPPSAQLPEETSRMQYGNGLASIHGHNGLESSAFSSSEHFRVSVFSLVLMVCVTDVNHAFFGKK